jgi:hypothetical protein
LFHPLPYQFIISLRKLPAQIHLQPFLMLLPIPPYRLFQFQN